MGENQIEVADAPAGFLGRPEFLPRVPAGREGEARRWLPEDPFFLPPLDASRGEAASPPGGGPGGLGPLFRSLAERWRLPLGPRARDLLALLDDPRTRLVVTGQQPGFLTGPLYTIYKAIAAVAAARRLEVATGRRHLPVFWVAGEDHDLDEARAARFPGTAGVEVEVALPHAADRRPLSAYPVDRAAEEALEAARSHLRGRRHAEQAFALLDLYPGRDLASGFAAVLARLFESQGLLLIEPEVLRPQAAPIIKRCLEEPAELMARIEEGIRSVEARGIRAQVAARFPLFLLVDGKRHHLSFEGPAAPGRQGGFRLEGVGQSYDAGELVRILESEPGRFSTGVLLRPVVQEALLPCALTMTGPAEIAYFAQLRPVFEWFGLPEPRVALRLSATLIEGKVARALRRLGLDPGGPGAGRWERAAASPDLLPPLEQSPEEALDAFAEEARLRLRSALADPRIPGDMRRRLLSAAERLARDIELLGARATRAVRGTRGQDLAAAEKVFQSFFPGGVLQERRWNIFYYLSKYGVRWIDELVEAAAADPLRVAHRWVYFLEGEEGGEE